jgi:hypothetical protein
MEEKLFSRTCPKCGSICSEKQIAKVNLGPGAQVNMCCENGHKWTEFYSLTYHGYWWNGKMYNSYGEEENDGPGSN